MSRLDKDRQTQLEPKRMVYAKEQIERLGIAITSEYSNKLTFIHNKNTIEFFPYSGWYSGKGIGSGRGLINLLNKLK